MSSYAEMAAIRLGFGLSPHLTPPADAGRFAASVAAAGPGGPDAVTLDRVRAWQDRGLDLGAAARAGDDGARDRDVAYRRRLGGVYRATIQDRFARAVDEPSGFGERLVGFWADHFTVTGGTVYWNLMTEAFVQDAIRPNLNGRFADMLLAAETHPAMVRYLDQDRSVGPNSVRARRNPDRILGLNENLAREMIELHSLGVGADYSQQDVTQLAELLTGLAYHPRHPGVFRPVQAEPGAETVLGVSYGGRKASLDDIRGVIADLARHPATARHIARKMAVHFVADDPPQPLVDRLAAVFDETGGDLGAMNLALAQAPELGQQFRQKMRQPFEFLVAAMRSLGVDGRQVRALKPGQLQRLLLQPMTAMGQAWGNPAGPDGWPEAQAAWASPQGLAMRITWALSAPAVLADPLPDARVFLRTALGDTASEALSWAVPRAESQAEGVALVLASADFNRR
ncbi:DUF1800 family protein [Paracoccus sp. Ld10]|uniref:DUF1800 domain-containing protein n=1 Tax=Paracoccus sp. Ld10 TaxID=649158 RepID=UPI003869DA6A